jgi:carbonic anhydrase
VHEYGVSHRALHGGQAVSLEIHFVHMNTKYSALGDAAGNKDGLLVVGQMFQVGTSESASLTAMAAMMATGGDVSVTPTDMMKNEDGFYAYAGSLTTPGCNEAVTWNKFLAIETDLLDHKLISKYGNYRNLQPRNGRTLYYSPGVQTAPCTVAAREPHFACDTEMGRTNLEIALAVLFAVVCPQAPRLLIVSSCMQSSGN